MGDAHREYLAQYLEIVGRTAAALQQDSRDLRPEPGAYSPFAIVYGFCADLFANMALTTLCSPSSPDLSIEDGGKKLSLTQYSVLSTQYLIHSFPQIRTTSFTNGWPA